MSVLVSVVMPAYNAEKYIETSIHSVLAQTEKNFELIIVDDSSTDQTRALIKEIQKSDPRIQLIALGTNKGVANARNEGIRASSGKYVAFLDADDQWDSDKLKIQITYMESKQLAFSYLSYRVVDDQGEKIGVRSIKEPTLTYKQLLTGNRIGLLTAVVKRDIIIAHQFQDVHHEDYVCWLSILKDGILAERASSEILASYRIHQRSLSANKFEAAKWTWQIYRRSEGLNLLQSLRYFASYAFMAVTRKR
ncbi:glycosyltransferase family 2 protein [Lacticaseibacillus suibinensis]|uniref:glycosyltransferase family 2 protein n=1 Tax=Lacticaseibacillus suibinensis TaxID=2486011 RepID=UPI001CDD5AAC|nr:glycosyltransferase family 2 protein [Lacticaseibacillus suibinensis]